ncbi:MAG: KEOPS complex kinase/ATPase Bud32 [Candidatus Nanohaloarchaea archaeon]
MEFKGAEADVEILKDKVVKTRNRKDYRHPELDRRIRKERTKTETRILEKARQNGVKVPEVLQKEENTIEMERIKGQPLKETIEENLEQMKAFGENVGRLHSAEVIHGDITTSNAISGEELRLIDFGLAFHSERIEDKAVDIHLLKQVLNSSHPGISEKAWNKFIEGYRNYDESGKVLEQLEEVEERGRYK